MDQTKTAPDAVVAAFPLTATQERCWFLDRINPGEPALNVAVRWELRGRVSAEAVERAFAHVIARHEILRTRFVERDGAPMQEVLDHAPFRLGQFDLRTTPEADRLARIDAIAHEEAERPFDLARPPLIRANLVRFDAGRAMLLIVAHQSVFDGYSIGILGREIGTAAAAFDAGGTPDLPDLPLQYGDVALWQRELHASGILEEEAGYWRETLAGAPYFEVQPDHPRPATRSTAVAMLHRPLPADFPDRLRAAAKAAGVTPFAFGAGAVSAALHRLTGASEVLMGTQIAGRTETDLEPLIGVFINNLVLRLPTAPDTTLAQQIAHAGTVVGGALAHQTMPFNRLVEILNPPRDASRNPLISVNYNLLEVFMKGWSFGDFELISVPSHAPGSVYDLEIVAIGRPEGGWRLTVEYRPDLFEVDTVERLLALVEDVFATAFAAPQTPLAALPIDPALERRGAQTDPAHAAIEAILRDHPMVAEAACIAAPTGPYAFVTARDTGTTPLERLPADILAYAEALGGAVPAGVSLLAALPRTASGGVDRTQLRAPTEAARVRTGTPPDPAVVEALRADWQDILGIDAVPPAASFFDLGGHSLLAVRLLARIRDRWAVPLGIAAIYENPTLPALAAAIAARRTEAHAAPTEDWRILRLVREGRAQPLIAVNNAATALALGGQFAEPHPISCVRLYDSGRGLDADALVAGLDFEEIAARYAEVIRAAQPEGPYLLYGNCVHGNLALEAARHLQAEGAEIAGVVMKDVWEPGYTARILADSGLRRREKLHALRNKLRMVRAGHMSLSAALGSYRIVRATGVLQAATALRLIDRVRLSDLEADQERFISVVTDARDRYRPAPLDLPVLHVVTRISPRHAPFSPSIGWDKVIAPHRLKTVHLGEVYVHRATRIGVGDLAREMEAFLSPKK